MRQEKKHTVGSERSRYMHATAGMGIRLGTVEKMNEGFFSCLRCVCDAKLHHVTFHRWFAPWSSISLDGWLIHKSPNHLALFTFRVITRHLPHASNRFLLKENFFFWHGPCQRQPWWHLFRTLEITDAWPNHNKLDLDPRTHDKVFIAFGCIWVHRTRQKW